MSKFDPIVRDIVGVSGAAVLLYGIAMLSVPAVLILGGGAAVGVALIWARNG